MKRIFAKGLVLALCVGFTACNDDDPAPYGSGELYVISKFETPEVEGETPVVVYALSMEAVGQNEIPSSVKVTGPGSANYTLDNTSGFFTKTSAYTTSIPAEGTYTFTYTFASGEVTTSQDILSDEVLEPATFTSVTVSSSQIELEWEEVEDADAIEIVLLNDDDEMIFRSTTASVGYLDGDETEYTIKPSTGTWGETPTTGESYTLQIRGLLGGSGSYYQAISIASKTVVWGTDTNSGL